jgi:hypothetical protein
VVQARDDVGKGELHCAEPHQAVCQARGPGGDRGRVHRVGIQIRNARAVLTPIKNHIPVYRRADKQNLRLEEDCDTTLDPMSGSAEIKNLEVEIALAVESIPSGLKSETP